MSSSCVKSTLAVPGVSRRIVDPLGREAVHNHSEQQNLIVYGMQSSLSLTSFSHVRDTRTRKPGNRTGSMRLRKALYAVQPNLHLRRQASSIVTVQHTKLIGRRGDVQWEICSMDQFQRASAPLP